MAYAGQACVNFVSTSEAFVAIQDDSRCSPSGDPACTFSPPSVSVPLGSSVVWENIGNLTHTVTANATLNNGLPSFDSGPLPPKGGFYSHTFDQTGTYHYDDVKYHWMKGVVVVNPLPPRPPPPPPTSRRVDLNGNINWTVIGLSNSQTNLNVTHRIGISVPLPGFTITPVTESGNFEQSINLSTRVESPSTTTSVVKSLLASLLPALAGATLVTSATGSIFQTMLPSQSNSPDYTMWWVNGPLSNGSPVQILHGWSSVTGSENLNLGTTIGTRSAWIVTSQLSQTIDITNPSNPVSISISTATASLKLLWSYDKSADLLLRNNSTISLTAQNMAPTTILAQVPCGTSFCISPVPVTVTRSTALTLSLALRLFSTSLKQLSTPSLASTLTNLLSVLPWMPLGIGGLAAGVAVALIFWFTRRAKTTTMPGPTPTTTRAAPQRTPS